MATLWSPLPVLTRNGATSPDDSSFAERLSSPVSGSWARAGANVAALMDLLEHEVARAKRYGRDLSIALFEAPLPAARGRRRALETTLGDNVRGSDIVVRLSDTLFALVLPETGPGVAAATERVTRLLTQVVGAPVTSGFARYPEDGRAAPDLLEHAMRRAHAAPAAEPDTDLAEPMPGSCPGTPAGPGAPTVSEGCEEARAQEVSPEAIRAAREEFLRAALRLAELEAVSRD